MELYTQTSNLPNELWAEPMETTWQCSVGVYAPYWG